MASLGVVSQASQINASASTSIQNAVKLSDSNLLLKKLPVSSNSFIGEFPYLLGEQYLLYGPYNAEVDGILRLYGKIYAPDRHYVPGDTIYVDIPGVHGAIYYLNHFVRNGDIIEPPKDGSDMEFHYKYGNSGSTLTLKSYNP